MDLTQALCDKLAAGASLVAMIGGSADFISGAWPDQDLKYTAPPPGTNDFAALDTCSPPRAVVVVTPDIAPNESDDLPTHDDVGSIDIFSASKRLNAAIADEIRATLNKQSLSVDGVRVTEMFCKEGPSLYESDTRTHHKVMSLRIIYIDNA